MHTIPAAAGPPVRAVLLAAVLLVPGACSPDAGPGGPPEGGARWIRVTSTTKANLLAVWGSGPQDVWVAGDNADREGAVGVALHWNGVGWRDVELPTEESCPRTFCRLRCVWGRGPDDVWAAGENQTLNAPQPVLRWNGASWARGPRSPVTSPGDPRLGWFGCGRGAGDEVWLGGGQGDLARWNGTTWSTESVVSEAGSYASWDIGGWLAGFWPSGAGDVWAVGHSPEVRFQPGWILHWDPDGWKRSLLFRERLEGIWGADPSQVWVVGTRGTILRWDGSEWTTAPSDSPATLRAIWGSSATDVWTVGDEGAILRWDGQSWIAVPAGTTTTLRGVWGSGPGDVWAVGDEGTILHWSP